MTGGTQHDRDWYSDETATFGDRLADARARLGLSAEDLAARVGVKATTLSAWENDISEPRAKRLRTLSELLDVSLRWLMTGQGEGLAPPAEAPSDPEVAEILAEMRQLRHDIARCADRLGRLERRLGPGPATP